MPAPARAQALGQVPWGTSSGRDLAAAVRLVKHIAVHLAWKAADDLAHLPGLEQRGQAVVGIAGVVVHHRQVARALRNQRVNQFAGEYPRCQSPDEHRGAIAHTGHRLGRRSPAILLIMKLSPTKELQEWAKTRTRSHPAKPKFVRIANFVRIMNYKEVPMTTPENHDAPSACLRPPPPPKPGDSYVQSFARGLKKVIPFSASAPSRP